MHELSPLQIQKILADHAWWLVYQGREGKRADFSNADLIGADFHDAWLQFADFSGANLAEANFANAKLEGANFESVKNMPNFQHVPAAGPFTAFKKVRDEFVVELLIPAEASRVSSTGTKCRASNAKVVRAFYVDRSGPQIASGAKYCSLYDSGFVYEIGKGVAVNNFDDDFRTDCARGIHFFMNFNEALDFKF